ncbi:MAG TPA: tetratricopeptide repeat protein [Stellaceae bacterium]|nr:tetratricopeptide repeat protein [Stellaceae bacterium]
MTQATRERRSARHPIVRPLMLTVFLALSACSVFTGKDTAGTRASGATAGNLAPEQSADTMLKVADETRAGGDLANAVALYRRAHELSPRDPAPLARAGDTLAQMQSYTEAAEAYQAALSIDANDPDLHRGFASVLLALGKPQLALAHLEIAVSKNSGDARVYNALGVAHDLAGRHDLAQGDYRRGMALAPDQLSLRNNLGLSQALSGDFNGGIATLSDVVARPGATARHRQNLALVYGLAGDDVHAALVARSDLDEAAVRNNLAYFTLLRSLDDVGRTAAILGADVRAARAAVPPGSTAKEPATAEGIPAPATVTRTAIPMAPSVAALSVPLKASKHLAPQIVPEPTPSTSLESAEPTPSANLQAAMPKFAEGSSNQGPTPPAADETTATQLASAAPVAMAPSAPKPMKHKAETASTEPSAAAPPPTPVSAPSTSAPVTVAQKAPAVGGKRLVVQLGAFQVEANANRLTSQLKAKGITDLVIIHDRDRQGRDWYVVRTADFATQEAAEAVAQSIRDAGDADARIIHIASSAD